MIIGKSAVEPLMIKNTRFAKDTLDAGNLTMQWVLEHVFPEVQLFLPQE